MSRLTHSWSALYFAPVVRRAVDSHSSPNEHGTTFGILVNAGPSADTTIAVRTPDGHTVCNDDSGDPGNGLNPVAVIENAAPGTYQVFVGGYEVGDAASAYRLGVTEAPDAMPSAAVPAP